MENLIAFFWGFAEATLFFIIPDVAISIISLRGLGSGLAASFSALAGALIGGAFMYYWGQKNIDHATSAIKKVPAIPAKDIEKVRYDLENSGIRAILTGPLLGIPYKIYAIYAHLITSIVPFLLISIPARGIRFIFVAILSPYIVNFFFAGLTKSVQTQTVLIIWILIYFFYFIVKRK